jgi:sulfite reductase beta subunit-like hemoprotein
VTLSLKRTGVPPGDVTSDQIDFIADLAERYSFAEARISHEQNVILADVREADLPAVWEAAKAQGLATPNIGLLTNIIACPAATSARSPMPSRSRSRKRSSGVSTTSTTCTTSASSTSTFPAA